MSDLPLSAWLRRLEVAHPKPIDLGLERIREVAHRLQLLTDTPRTIVVAGTNGKGSTVAALVALLRARGEVVGAYTSPHLVHYNERIAVNGQPCSDNVILQAFTAIEAAQAEISLSYFEFATLAALWVFKQQQVAWQVLEVGLGGRLDAVNIVDAEACVITSIGLDHTEWLGPTREAIAPEKAAVARPDRPAIVAERDRPSSLLATLDDIGAQCFVIGEHWQLNQQTLTLPSGVSLKLPSDTTLLLSNLAAAAVCLESLDALVDVPRAESVLADLQVPGRQQQCVYAGREVWFDVAHNQESVSALAKRLRSSPPVAGKTHTVFGAMADKPLHDMINVMREHTDCWHLPEASDVARAALPSELASAIAPDASECYSNAQQVAAALASITSAGDRIVVFGSFITVGAQLECLLPALTGDAAALVRRP